MTALNLIPKHGTGYGALTVVNGMKNKKGRALIVENVDGGKKKASALTVENVDGEKKKGRGTLFGETYASVLCVDIGRYRV